MYYLLDNADDRRRYDDAAYRLGEESARAQEGLPHVSEVLAGAWESWSESVQTDDSEEAYFRFKESFSEGWNDYQHDARYDHGAEARNNQWANW
jgi:hypothetical protein